MRVARSGRWARLARLARCVRSDRSQPESYAEGARCALLWRIRT
jgi:hypothetical protein